jgi:methyl-accepting chemotaxis protein
MNSFRTGLIAGNRSEAEVTSRMELEEQRARAEAERDAAAKDVEHIVHSLAEELDRLSSEVLIDRLTQALAPDCERLRGDFKGALGRLQDAIKTIATNPTLNAAVATARAGDAGRAFTVLVSEVTVLTQRSADAAKDIMALISIVSKQIGSGVDLVGQTGKALQRRVIQIVEIDEVVTQTTAAAQETEEVASLIAQFQISGIAKQPSRQAPCKPVARMAPMESPARAFRPAIAQLKTTATVAARKLAIAGHADSWEEV